MPLGEIIGEVILRAIFEIAFGWLWYWTGHISLTLCSFGQLKIAPLASLDQRRLRRSKKKRKDRPKKSAIWKTDADGNNRQLRAELTICAGLCVWILAGVGLYLLLR
jgi:hypothetical protein